MKSGSSFIRLNYARPVNKIGGKNKVEKVENIAQKLQSAEVLECSKKATITIIDSNELLPETVVVFFPNFLRLKSRAKLNSDELLLFAVWPLLQFGLDFSSIFASIWPKRKRKFAEEICQIAHFCTVLITFAHNSLHFCSLSAISEQKRKQTGPILPSFHFLPHTQIETRSIWSISTTISTISTISNSGKLGPKLRTGFRTCIGALFIAVQPPSVPAAMQHFAAFFILFPPLEASGKLLEDLAASSWPSNRSTFLCFLQRRRIGA